MKGGYRCRYLLLPILGISLLLMGKQNHRKAIQSLEKRIAEHQEKIRLELLKENPDRGLIKHWEKEIRAFQKGIEQALKRLGRK
ncbi:hypothetical protein VB834_20410 [Limnoraphis robusta Tam1]|uniref:hypothetical protein n=1 Tax=Limnoraphis robusta TaxID=1118279 RepID=UPI002B21F407|nr:hypothetical protein [Limnoraphis robusta]MEA5500586.1 hypothetical protein [Limnoraphis robusta BA-68 BA1]MEA5541394.1 hypothetical protein [Limnoraphis robusta Tam1]